MNKIQELLHLCQIENNTTLSSIKKTASQLPWWDNSDASKEIAIKTFVIQNDIPCTPYYINQQNNGYGIAVLNCTTEKNFIPRIINWINQIATNLNIQVNVKIYNVFSGVVPTVQDLIDSNIYCIIGTGGNYNGRSQHGSIMAYKAFLKDLHKHNKANEKVIKMFAICASHQILSQSLGGDTIENDKFEYALQSDYPLVKNKNNWHRIGIYETNFDSGEKMFFAQYHTNQINIVGDDDIIKSKRIGSSKFCLNDVLEYRKNGELLYFSMQGHPEKTPKFCIDKLMQYKEIHDLKNELKPFMPDQDYGIKIGVKIFKQFLYV